MIWGNFQVLRKIRELPGIQLLDGYGICRAEGQAMAAESAMLFVEGADLFPIEKKYGGAGGGAGPAGGALSRIDLNLGHELPFYLLSILVIVACTVLEIFSSPKKPMRTFTMVTSFPNASSAI